MKGQFNPVPNPQGPVQLAQIDKRKRLIRNILLALGITGGAFLVVLLILYIAFPSETSLFFNALGSVLSNPSQSKSFAAPGVSFNYPANWVPLNTTQFTTVIAKVQNSNSSQSFGNKSQVAIIVPASEVLSFATQGPTLLGEYLSNPTNFTLPSNLSFTAAGAITVLNHNFSPATTILEVEPNATITNTTIGGYNGINVQFSNQKILNISVVFAELSIAEVNGSVCFVLSIAGSEPEVSSVQQAFQRATGSIQCSFDDIGTSIPAPILDKFLSLIG